MNCSRCSNDLLSKSLTQRCFPSQLDFVFSFRCPEKMADDIDIEAMLEAPYKKVRKTCQ